MSSFLNLEIQEVIKETHDTVSLLLKNKNGNSVSFQPGQFLTFLFEEKDREVRRGFSISSSPDELPYLRVTIKKVHQDSVSTRCVDEAKVGQVIKSLPPLGHFTVIPSPDLEREFIMFGAGSGITPLISMIQSILKHENKSKIVLYYGNRNESSIIFKDEIAKLMKEYPMRLRVIHVLSQPTTVWEGLKGRITQEMALELLSSILFVDPQKASYYLCGPDGMMQNVIHTLDEMKIDHKRIHRENFVIKILDENDEIEEVEREVTIFFKGQKHLVNVKPGESIQQKALQLGLELPNSCQHGECGTCRARLLSGKLKLVSQTALTEEELKDGYCLTCVGYPASENVVILYEDPFDDF